MDSEFYFKLERAPAIVPLVLESRGWTQHQEQHGVDNWSLFWKNGRPKPSEFANGKPYQRYNHFPKTSVICRKDSLCRILRKMKAVHGGIYNFFPVTFMVPNEYTKFVNFFSEQKSKGIWICKPNDMSRGRKIFVFKDILELVYDTPCIVQKYISNPFLIEQRKWDMRVYVLVTDFHPLTVYIYKEGLARFSSENYDTSDLENKFSHLTNASINKYNTESGNNKWDFSSLEMYLESQGVSYTTLWKRIQKIVVLTLVTLIPTVPQIDCCFELLGFDIIIDENIKPWILEVNSSPALGVECFVDAKVKTALVNDIIDVLKLQSPTEYWAAHPPKKTKLKQPEALQPSRSSTPAPDRISIISDEYSDLVREITNKHLSSPSANFELVFPHKKQLVTELNKLKKAAGSRDFNQVCQRVMNSVINDFKTSK